MKKLHAGAKRMAQWASVRPQFGSPEPMWRRAQGHSNPSAMGGRDRRLPGSLGPASLGSCHPSSKCLSQTKWKERAWVLSSSLTSIPVTYACPHPEDRHTDRHRRWSLWALWYFFPWTVTCFFILFSFVYKQAAFSPKWNLTYGIFLMVQAISVVYLRNPFWIQSQGVFILKAWISFLLAQNKANKQGPKLWSYWTHRHEPTTVDLYRLLWMDSLVLFMLLRGHYLWLFRWVNWS